jgi:hypothetical protein
LDILFSIDVELLALEAFNLDQVLPALVSTLFHVFSTEDVALFVTETTGAMYVLIC